MYVVFYFLKGNYYTTSDIINTGVKDRNYAEVSTFFFKFKYKVLTISNLPRYIITPFLK